MKILSVALFCLASVSFAVTIGSPDVNYGKPLCAN